MFWHAFSYRLKTLLRRRSFLFWTLLFPLILASFYHFAFGHMNYNYAEFAPISLAIVDPKGLVRPDLLNQSRQLGESFFVSRSEGLELLATNRVAGVLLLEDEAELIIKEAGPEQAILQALLERYFAEAPLSFEHDYTREISFSDTAPNSTLSLFYALIAMTCIYGSYWGILNATDLQADQSARGGRRSIAPTHKLILVFSDTLAALVVSFAEVLILLAFLHLVLGVEFGKTLYPILLVALAGTWAGVAMGGFVGTVVKGDQRFKSRVLLLVNNLTSIAAGLVSVNLRDTIARKFPLVAKLNPAGLIADSFYSLSIYGVNQRLYTNLAYLCLIALGLSLASFAYLRRERYASL